MALFTDGTISDIGDLRAYDSGILEVAGAEGIDLDAKLKLASAEIGAELEEFFVRRLGGPSGYGRKTPELGQVIVTAPLKQWHTLRTLGLIYGDVRGNHMDSRYEAKWDEFQRRGRWVAESLFRIGVGLTKAPLPKAEEPLPRTESGTNPASKYQIQAAWTNSAGENGAPSDVLVYLTSTDSALVIAMPEAPVGATGFNVYVGADGGEVTLQNVAPIPVSGEWRIADTGLVQGLAPDEGQEPQWFLRNDRILRRG